MIRLFFKIVFYVFIGFVLIIGSLYMYLFQFGGVERIINNKISSLVEEKYLLDINIGGIKGNIFSGLIIEDITVIYDDSISRYQLLKLPRISTAYSILNLWDKKYILDYLIMDSAEITLIKDNAGRLLIPDFFPKERLQEKSYFAIPSFSVGNFGLNHLTLKVLENGDTLSFNDIIISLALKREDKTVSVDVEQFEFSSNQQKVALDAAGGKITFSENRLLFKDLTVVSNETRMKLNGYVLLEQALSGNIEFTLININLNDITKYIGPKLSGVLDLNGTVSFVGDSLKGIMNVGGYFMIADFQNLFINFHYAKEMLSFDTLYGTILGNCAIDGNGYIDFSGTKETYLLIADIKQFNLSNLIENSFDSDLNGRIILNGESFRNRDLVLNISTSLYESSFDEYPLQKASGNLVITTDSIIFVDSFQVDYFENVFYTSGKVDYSEEISLLVKVQLNNLDRYKGKLFIEQPGGRGYAEAVISGKTSDPDLNGFFISDSLWLYGLYSDSLYAGVNIKRFLTGEKGDVRIDFFQGTAWGIPYDTGFALLNIDSNLVFFDTLYIKNPFSYLITEGIYDCGDYPGLLTVDSLMLNLFGQPFYNRASINVNVDSSGFDFVQAAIGNNGAKLNVKGRTNYDETMDLYLSLNQIPIEPWKNLFEESLQVDGLLSCEGLLTGSFKQPQIILEASVDSLLYRDLLLGNLTTRLRYDNRLLMIDSLSVYSRTGVYHADGSFYIDLAFTADSIERFPELPMSINVTAEDNRFDLVTLLMPTVELLEGDLYSDFILSGTPQKPHLEGEMFIRKARLKYFDLEAPIFSDSVGITMSDNKIIIDNVATYVYENKGKQNGKKRYAYIDGEMIVKSLENFYYNLNVSIQEQFPFSYELEDIRGQVEGDLHIEGETPPLVTGDLKIVSMKYLVNFAEPGEGSPIMMALSGENMWDLDFTVDILSKYWIKNEDVDAEFSGQINLIRENGVYRLAGEMEIIRGKGFLFDKIFRLEPGSRVIFEGNETFNPLLDIVGYARIPGSRRSLGDETETVEQLKLGIHITGSLEEPEINVTEDSDVGSREDILPLIVANYYSSDSATASGSFGRRMTDIISTQMSQIGSRQLGRLGVETFELNPHYAGELHPLETQVTLGFYTSQNLYVFGRSALLGQSRQEVGFEYRLNKSFLIQGLRDEEELYHLNLKLHWEF